MDSQTSYKTMFNSSDQTGQHDLTKLSLSLVSVQHVLTEKQIYK